MEQEGASQQRPRTWSRIFWQRFVHPDTGSLAGGPEPDLVLDAQGWRYVIESKWLADLDDREGHEGKTSQLTMRLGVAQRGADDAAKRGVLVIVPGPTRYRNQTTFARYFAADGVTYRSLQPAIETEARAITWEQVIDAIEREAIPNAEVVRYLRWRLERIGE